MAVKVDYELHQAELTRLVELDPSLTVRQYCEQAGLVYASARRYLKSPRAGKTETAQKAKVVREKREKRGRSTARDWPAIYLDYLTSCQSHPALSINEFATDRGIPPASARKNFNELKKEGVHAELQQQVSDALALLKDKAGSGYQRKERARAQAAASVHMPGDKRDWPALYDAFLDGQVENPVLSMSIFANANGLPASVVRRNFAEQRKSGAHCEREDRARQAIEAYRANAAAEKVRAKALTGRQKRPRGHERALSTAAPIAAHNGSEQDQGSTDRSLGSAHALYNGRDSRGRFLQGHDLSVIHGGYAKLSGLDPDIIQVATELDPASLANELVVVRSQYLSMMQFLQTEQAAIIQQYAEGNPKLDYDDNEIPLSKALGDLMFGCAGKLRSLEASIGAMVGTQAKIMTDFAKIAQKEHELSPVDSLTALSIRKRIMDDMDKKGWTALQAAREFERHGIKVPESILEEAKREISEYEPPIDDSGISDDELDRQTAEYLAEQQQFHDVWLPQRQAELANIIDTEVEDEVINDDELELDEGEWDDDEGMDLSDFDGDDD